MSAEQPKPQEGTFEGTQDYEALVADSARRGEPETREHNPVRAEHMGHAMKPHMEDATMLDTMSDKALAESQEARSAGSGARKLALGQKLTNWRRPRQPLVLPQTKLLTKLGQPMTITKNRSRLELLLL